VAGVHIKSVDPDRIHPNNEVSGVSQMTFCSAALRLQTIVQPNPR
jgi:hypothetical protein